MSVFQEIKLFWADNEYKVAPSEVLRLIFIIEQHVTLEDLCPGAKGYKRAAIAYAYCAALAHVGCVTATPEKVYESLFSDTTMERLAQVINGLILLLVPPEKLKAQMTALEKEVKKDAKKKQKLGREL